MTTRFDKGRALIIGVADYQKFGSLPEAVAHDASDFAALLCDSNYCGYPSDQVEVLLNEQATKKEIVDRLHVLAEQARPTDTVVIFFSGHGARSQAGSNIDNYLLPTDYDPARIRASALHSDEFTSLTRQIGAQRLVILLDACHSAGAADISKVVRPTTLKLGLDEDFYDRLASGAGRVMIASSKASEVSWVHSGMRNSVFTGCLLQSLKGGSHIRSDGLIHVLDVFHDLSEKIPALEPRQHPILKVHDADNNFPLALCGARTAETPFTPSRRDTPLVEEIWRELEQLAIDLYPRGPTDAQIWRRAGGDLSRLSLESTGAAAWHDALARLRQGGGGGAISFDALVNSMKSDFSSNGALQRLLRGQQEKSRRPTEVTKRALTITTASTRHILRFAKIVTGEAGALTSDAPLTISEFPLTQQDLSIVKPGIKQLKKRNIALLNRSEVSDILKLLHDANLSVRLPTYSEWRFAMAANGDASSTPQHTVPDGVEPTIDHWVRNEWGIGRPPASICEWIDERTNPVVGRAVAPVGCIKVKGGAITFNSATRSIQSLLPLHLVLESEH